MRVNQPLHQQLRLLSGALCLSAAGLWMNPAWAEGSRDLTSSGGDRPYLEFRTDTNAGMPRRTTVKVYAKNGETINLGSSTTGMDPDGAGGQPAATISYRRPDGSSGSCTPGVGLIADRNAELAGPFHPTTNTAANAFAPCTVAVTAATEGIWEIDFASPQPTDLSNPPSISAAANWTQNTTVSWVAAWDVTVRDSSGNAQAGRAFVNYLAMNMGSNGRSLSSLFYIQTFDGYGYTIDNNGNDPFGFIFFANNKGFFDQTTGGGIYRSLELLGSGSNPTMPPGYDFHRPSIADDTANNNYTHKIFFSSTGPDPTMPAMASSPTGTTWLYTPPQPPPVPASLTFTGIEGTAGAAGTSPLGGNFQFTAPRSGAFTIKVDTNRNGIYGDSTDRILIGTAVAGINTVFWDGRDGSGAIVPASNIGFSAIVEMYAGEVHFPFLDAENNPAGLIVRRVVDPGTNPSPPSPYIVNYDDRYNYTGSGTYDYSLCASGQTPAPPAPAACAGTPPVPRSALAGVLSTGGAHSWSSNFGDRRMVDTWAYYPSAYQQLPGEILVREADLAVTKTDGRTTISPGSATTYTIQVTNNGPSDAIGASFSDTVPASITNVTWTCTASSGSSCGTASGSGNTLSSTVTLLNGGTLTYTVTGTVSPSATGSITNTATILRPNDTNDPTDPNRTGAGNNTATDTTTIVAPVHNVVGTKSIRFFADTDNSGSVTVNDEVEYTIEYSNISPSATSDVVDFVIQETLPAQLSYIPGSATISQTNGNNITLNPAYNGSGALTTLVTGSNPSRLRVNDTITIRLRARITSTNGGNPISNQATATFRIPTSGTSETIVTDARSNGGTTATPTVGNAFLQTDDDGVNTGNTTSTGDDEPTLFTAGASLTPRLRLVKRITRINGVDVTGFVDDPGSDDNAANWPQPLSTYLRGAIDGGQVRPGDEIEYTIYFLSDGGTAARNVRICDPLPTNTTLQSTAFNGLSPGDGGIPGADSGIALAQNSAALPTVPTQYLTNVADAPDRGQWITATMATPAACTGSNPNGAVLVNVATGATTLPNSTGVGTPAGSYGFIRFRVRVN